MWMGRRFPAAKLKSPSLNNRLRPPYDYVQQRLLIQPKMDAFMLILHSNPKIKSIIKTVGFIVIFLSLCCSLIYIYLGPLANWEANNCAQRIAPQLGVEPKFRAIYAYVKEYLEENLDIGMSRNDVILKLQRLGPTKMLTEKTYYGSRDDIKVTFCRHPLNYIEINIGYDSDGKLKEYGLPGNN
jgi:hypothetical protein